MKCWLALHTWCIDSYIGIVDDKLRRVLVITCERCGAVGASEVV